MRAVAARARASQLTPRAVILLLRTYALYNRSRKVLYFLLGVFIVRRSVHLSRPGRNWH